jgi:hypothetical protein
LKARQRGPDREVRCSVTMPVVQVRDVWVIVHQGGMAVEMGVGLARGLCPGVLVPVMLIVDV